MCDISAVRLSVVINAHVLSPECSHHPAVGVQSPLQKKLFRSAISEVTLLLFIPSTFGYPVQNSSCNILSSKPDQSVFFHTSPAPAHMCISPQLFRLCFCFSTHGLVKEGRLPGMEQSELLFLDLWPGRSPLGQKLRTAFPGRPSLFSAGWRCCQRRASPRAPSRPFHLQPCPW